MSRLAYLFPQHAFEGEALPLRDYLIERLRMYHQIVLDDVVQDVLTELCEHAVTNEGEVDRLSSEVQDLKDELKEAEDEIKDAEDAKNEAENAAEDAEKKIDRIEEILETLPEDDPVANKIRDVLEEF